jgi:polyphenol oxidase
MEIIQTFQEYEICITHQLDGDMRINDHLSSIIRPYHQVHGTDIGEYFGNGDAPFMNVDGIYTKVPGVAIGWLCADCPILLFLWKGEVAAIHSGWKGTKANIVEHAISFFQNTARNEIQVFIWPHIWLESYEVQSDFFAHFPMKYIHEKEWKYYFDIESVLIDQLSALGILKNNIISHGDDTFKEKKYYSYRRDGMIWVWCVSVKML